MLDREAIQYLVELGKDEAGIIEAKNGDLYTVGQMKKITEPTQNGITLHTLTGVIDYIKSNADNCLDEDLIVEISSPTEVCVYGYPNKDKRRNEYICCEAIRPTNFRYESFYDVENFNILLQSVFDESHDKELLQKVTGLVKEENVKSTGDDGVGQAVTVKTGITTVADVKIPNPVVLKPYRTFQEIEQPESKFIFRMKNGPTAALFEADGGIWRNAAINNIKDYLAKGLNEVITNGFNIRIIG